MEHNGCVAHRTSGLVPGSLGRACANAAVAALFTLGSSALLDGRALAQATNDNGDSSGSLVPSGDAVKRAPDPGVSGETGSGLPNAVPTETGAPIGTEQPAAQTERPPDQPAPVYPDGYTPPPGLEYGVQVAPEGYGEAPVADDLGLEGSPGAREHDGFFLRLSIGPGAGVALYREKVDTVHTDDVEARGLAGLFDLAMGGRVYGNLILHGNVLFTRFDSPTRHVDGVKDAALHVTSSSTMVGGGASYYFMPLNVYLTSSLGLAWAFEERGNDQLRSGTGMFVVVAAGKEWWVGRSGEWGLGAALRGTFAAAPVDIAGVESTLKLMTLGLAFSATFN